MLINLGPTKVTTVVHADDPFAVQRDPFASAVAGDPGTSTSRYIPTITMSAKQISLYDAISVVCAAADLQWAVVGSSVVVRPAEGESINAIPRNTAFEIAVWRETLEDATLEAKNYKRMASHLRDQLPPPIGESVLDITVVPETEFRRASIEEVAGFLTEAAKKYAPPTPAESIKIRQEMAATLAKEAKQLEAYLDQKPVKAIILDIPANVEVPLVTFKARGVSLRELLEITTQISDLEYGFTDSIITIRPITREE